MMRAQLNHTCEQHPGPSDCPDALVGLFEDGRAGLIVHDGGPSMILIAYCPWCAVRTGTTLDD
jgi:hypothetical protein